MAAEDVGVGEGLVEAFVPSPTADVEPELDVHRAVGHQEGVRGGEENGIGGLGVPTADVLGGDQAVAHHLQVFFADRTAIGLDLFADDPPEVADGVDQVGDHFAGVEGAVEAVAGLGQAFPKQAVEEEVEGVGRVNGVFFEPGAQAFVAFAQDVGDALLHVRGQVFKGAEDRAGLGAVEDFGEELGADEVEAVYRFEEGVGDIERGGGESPLRVGERGQGLQALRGGVFAEGAGGAVRLNGYASPFEPVHQRKAQGVGEVGSEDDDLTGRDVFFLDEALDFGGEPVEELGVEAEGGIVNGELGIGNCQL